MVDIYIYFFFSLNVFRDTRSILHENCFGETRMMKFFLVQRVCVVGLGNLVVANRNKLSLKKSILKKKKKKHRRTVNLICLVLKTKRSQQSYCILFFIFRHGRHLRLRNANVEFSSFIHFFVYLYVVNSSRKNYDRYNC